jgi:dolichyl-phosphate-mannose--protein O-mannosyl transferase
VNARTDADAERAAAAADDAAFDDVLELDAPTEPEEPEPTGTRLDRWWERQTAQAQRAYRWGAFGGVVAIAAATRLWNLGSPGRLVFDETYYVKDGWSLWNLGYEASWPAESDPRFNAGQTDIYLTDPSYVVHPPLGKWIIGAGMALFGPDNPTGWRIGVAVAGILLVVLTMLVMRRLTRSTVVPLLAGLLLAVDGIGIVMSRVGLLDGILALFVLLGVGAVLLDRQWSAVRLAAWIRRREDAGRPTDWGPALLWRPWLLAAAVAFGLASAVKWNGLYFLAAFALYSVVSDILARRRAGIAFWLSATLMKQAPVSFLLTVPLALAVYLSTWTGWFLSDNGYDRHWAEVPGNAWSGPLSWVPLSLQSLWHFEAGVYGYHVGESRPHGYQANPWTWLLMVRPTSMLYEGADQGVNGCLAQHCGTEIIALGNPFIWWAATAAALYLLYRLIRTRDWRIGFVLLGLGAGYIPWLFYPERTVFQFYTIAFLPYLCMGLALALGMLLGSGRDPTWRRLGGIRVVGVYLAFVIAGSIFFWPLWAGVQLDFTYLQLHWWLPSWR